MVKHGLAKGKGTPTIAPDIIMGRVISTKS